MIKNKKIVIIEDDPGSFSMIFDILSRPDYLNKIYPQKDLNNPFLTKIHSFSLRQTNEKKDTLNNIITTYLIGEPDYIILDWEIYKGSTPRQGEIFRDHFLNSNFLNCTLLEISEYIIKKEKISPNRFLYNKNYKGSSEENRRKNYIEIFNEHK